eukprot:SAG22_NODE_53_length_24242_cov_158.884231_25_plen_106_part_00
MHACLILFAGRSSPQAEAELEFGFVVVENGFVVPQTAAEAAATHPSAQQQGPAGPAAAATAAAVVPRPVVVAAHIRQAALTALVKHPRLVKTGVLVKRSGGSRFV